MGDMTWVPSEARCLGTRETCQWQPARVQLGGAVRAGSWQLEPVPRDNSPQLEQRRGSCSCGQWTLSSGAEDSAQCSGVTSLGPTTPCTLSADAQSWPVTSIYISTYLHIYISTYLHIYIAMYLQWQLATAGSMLSLVIQTVCKHTLQLQGCAADGGQLKFYIQT